MSIYWWSLQIVFVFISAYEPNNEVHGRHLMKHGDGAKDVAFAVDDLDIIVEVSLLRYAPQGIRLTIFIYLPACQRTWRKNS